MPADVATAEPQWTRATFTRRRYLAACIDSALAVLLGLLLSSTLGQWAAERAAVLLRVGEPDTIWQGPLPLMLGAIGNLSYSAPILLFLVVLPEAAVGIGPGKAATGLCILPVASRRPFRLVLRFLLKAAPCLVWFLALSAGQPWTLALFVVSLLLFTGGCLPLLYRRNALHDRWAQTRVVEKRSSRM